MNNQFGAPFREESEPVLSAEEIRQVEALRRGEEWAFTTLFELYQVSMLRLARLYVADPVVAEEVVQDAWLGVLNGIGGFEGRSSLKTWIFRILANRAKTRALRERRSIPFSDLWNPDDEPVEPAVEPERFRPEGDSSPHGWITFPTDWRSLPEERLLADETFAVIRAAIADLPPGPREVIALRDIEGWTSEEVCNVLELSDTNQRVLLHRARSKVRRALERYLDGK